METLNFVTGTNSGWAQEESCCSGVECKVSLVAVGRGRRDENVLVQHAG